MLVLLRQIRSIHRQLERQVRCTPPRLLLGHRSVLQLRRRMFLPVAYRLPLTSRRIFLVAAGRTVVAEEVPICCSLWELNDGVWVAAKGCLEVEVVFDRGGGSGGWRDCGCW